VQKHSKTKSMGAPDTQAPLDEAITGYLEHLRVHRRLAVRSLAIYTQALRRLQDQVLKHAQGLTLHTVQTQHVRRWMAQVHGQGLAPRSLALMLSAWRGFYSWLVREGVLAHNPVLGVRAPKAAKPLPKALSVDQAMALVEPAVQKSPQLERDPNLAASPSPSQNGDNNALQAAREARLQLILELLYGCGLRINELVTLDMQPSDRASAWIDAQDAVVHVVGKGNKHRSVPLGPPALQALRDWLQQRALLANSDETALIVGASGKRLSAQQIRLHLKKRAQDRELPTHVHPHMLRHSFASHLLQSSGDLRGVQELLGHAHITSTQIYTRLDFGHLSKVYDAAHPRAKKK
jgi:integrase/recombinase XerC